MNKNVNRLYFMASTDNVDFLLNGSILTIEVIQDEPAIIRASNMSREKVFELVIEEIPDYSPVTVKNILNYVFLGHILSRLRDPMRGIIDRTSFYTDSRGARWLLFNTTSASRMRRQIRDLVSKESDEEKL